MSARSLRYHEDEGLIVPGRFSNGYRDYCQSSIDRVAAIRSLLESGLPVRLVRDLLGAEVLCSEFVSEVAQYRDRLAQRVAVLSAQQAALDAYLREVGA